MKRATILLILLATYIGFGLAPRGLKIPDFALNHAHLGGSDQLLGGSDQLHFPAAGISRTSGPAPWIAAAIEEGSFDIRVRLKSAFERQQGPARILTISRSASERNLTIGQRDSDLIVRMRTPDTDQNGMPELSIPDVFADRGWHDVQVAFADDTLHIWVDGDEAETVPVQSNALATWDPTYPLSLGNELTFDRAWLGNIGRAEFRVNSAGTDLLMSRALLRPLLVEVRTPPGQIPKGDIIINLLGFVPLGLLVGLGWRPACWPSLALAIGAVSAFSAWIEIVQLWLPQRDPSLTDLGLNTAGGFLGLLLAIALLKSRRPPRPAVS